MLEVLGLRLNESMWGVLFLALVIFALFDSRLTRSLNSLRWLIVLCLFLSLSNPELRRVQKSKDLWALFDRSSSSAERVLSGREEWVEILRSSKPEGSELHVMEFAGKSSIGPSWREDSKALEPSESRIITALSRAVSFKTSAKAQRQIVLFSDGYFSDRPEGLEELLLESETKLFIRPTFAYQGLDFQLEGLRLPKGVSDTDPFLLSADIVSSDDEYFEIELFRDGQSIARRKGRTSFGRAEVDFLDQISDPGVAHRYSARIISPVDAIPQNNSAVAWLSAAEKSKVLVLSSLKQDPIAESLKRSGYQVLQFFPESGEKIAKLAGARFVILNNVLASHLGSEFLAALSFFVQKQGAGLLVVGGANSFGSGGYFGSPIDPVLPVTTELRSEDRLRRSALVYVLDRSGSMGMGVGGHSGSMTKMDLANEGTARSIDLLSASDSIALLAVDTKAHIVRAMAEIGSEREKLFSLSRSVRSAGGGIYVYEGLSQAWEQLKELDRNIARHIILFSDANDSEEPGEYKSLIEQIRKAGASISVIALGSRGDADADLLEEIAKLGDGRAFFVNSALELPAVFAQETVSISRSQFISEEIETQPSLGWDRISEKPITWPSTVDGYNLNYLRPRAFAPLLSRDEYEAPLLAAWEIGRGRAAAIAFPLDNEKRVMRWPSLDQMLETLVEWGAREELPGGLESRVFQEGNEVSIELFFDETWTQSLAESLPKLVLSSPSRSRELLWDSFLPGRLTTRFELPASELVHGAIQFANRSLAFGPFERRDDQEFRRPQHKYRELLRIAERSGGGEVMDLSTLWESAAAGYWYPVRDLLLIAALLLVLIDVLLSRLGGRLFSGRASSRASQSRGMSSARRSEVLSVRRKIKDKDQRKTKQDTEREAPERKLEYGDAARSRFQRAKKRGL